MPRSSLSPGLVALTFALLAAVPAATACSLVSLSSPAPGQTLAEPRPTLRWAGEAGAAYRVQLALVLPESGLLASHDVEVDGTRWTLPAALHAERAAVKVVVSRDCPSLQAQDLHARGPAFFIDLRAACAVPGGALRLEAGRIEWAAVPGAQAYQVRVFREAGVDDLMELVEQARVDLPAFILERPEAGAVVTVQPLCEGRPGRMASQVLR